MSDLFATTEPENEEEEEFESLFESFQGREDEPAAGESRLGVFRRLFNSLTGRKKAAEAKAADAAEQDIALPERKPGTGADMDMSAPLDMDSARLEMLAPEEEEPPVQEKPQHKKRFGRKWGLSQIQLVILSILLLLVLAVYGVLATVMLRNRDGWDSEPATQAAVVESTPLGETTVGIDAPAATATPLAAEDEEEIAGEPTATLPPATATPLPAAPTRLDLQVMQDPNNLELRLERGMEYLRLRDYPAALRDFEYAVELDSESAVAHLGRGRAYIFLRRWAEAEDALSTAVAFNSELEEPHFWLGWLFYQEARYEEAAAEFDWAAEINRENPLNEAWLARAAVKSENLEEAQGAVERAFALDAEVPLAYLARSEVQTLENDIESALGDLLYAKSLAVHDFKILNSLARFYLEYKPERLGEAEVLAQQAYNWATWEIEKALALQTMARIRVEQGRREEAKTMFAEASDLALVDGEVGLPELVTDIDTFLADD